MNCDACGAAHVEDSATCASCGADLVTVIPLEFEDLAYPRTDASRRRPAEQPRASAATDETRRSNGQRILLGAVTALVLMIFVGVVTGGQTPEPDAEADDPSSLAAAEASAQPEPTAVPTTELDQPPIRGESFLVEDLPLDELTAIYEVFNVPPGTTPEPFVLSTTVPLRWRDGSRVFLELSAQMGLGRVSVAEQTSAHILVFGASGFVVDVWVEECDEDTKQNGSINSAGLLVLRIDDNSALACRPDHRVRLSIQDDAGVQTKDLAVLDVGLVEMGREVGEIYTKVGEIDTPGVPGRVRVTGPRSVATDRGLVNLVAEGFLGGDVSGLDVDTGEPLWTRATGEDTAFLLGVFESDGPDRAPVALVAPNFGSVMALDARTGTVLWTLPLDAKEAPAMVVSRPVAPGVDSGSEPRVAFLTTNFEREQAGHPPMVRALDIASGEIQWAIEGDRETKWQWGAPLVHEDMLLVMDQVTAAFDTNATVRAIDTATGSLRWSTSLPASRRFGSATLVSNPDVIADSVPGGFVLALTGGLGGEVVRIDPRDGAAIWRSPARGSILTLGSSGAEVGTLTDPITLQLIDAQGLSLSDGQYLTDPRRASANRESCRVQWNDLVGDARVDFSRVPAAVLVASVLSPSRILANDSPACVVTGMSARSGAGSCEQVQFSGDLVGPVSGVDCLDASREGDATLYGSDGRRITQARLDVPARRLVSGWSQSEGLVIDNLHVAPCRADEGAHRVCATRAADPRELVWTADLGPDDLAAYVYGVMDEIVVAAPTWGQLVGLDVETGEQRWTYSLGEGNRVILTVEDRAQGNVILLVAVTDGPQRVVSLNPVDGTEVWALDHEAASWDPVTYQVIDRSLLLLARSGELGPAGENGYILSISLDTGEVLWISPPETAIVTPARSRMFVEPGRGLLLVANGGPVRPLLFRLDVETGALEWVANVTGSDVIGIEESNVVTLSVDGDVVRRSLSTGALSSS